MPVCESCSAIYEESSPVCPYCGRPKPGTPKIDLEVSLKRNRKPEDCPKCENDVNTQKVSSIYTAGTSTGVSRTFHSGSADHYRSDNGKRIGTSQSSSSSSSYSLNQSKLAEKLIPPTKPVKKQKTDIIPIIITVLAAIPACVIVFQFTDLPDTSPFFGTICTGLGIWILFVVILTLIWNWLSKSDTDVEEDTYQAELKIYQKAMYVWDHLYYCHKHDIVFMEGQEEFADVENTRYMCYQWGEKFVKFEESGDENP